MDMNNYEIYITREARYRYYTSFYVKTDYDCCLIGLTPCSRVEFYRRFRGFYWLFHSLLMDIQDHRNYQTTRRHI